MSLRVSVTLLTSYSRHHNMSSVWTYSLHELCSSHLTNRRQFSSLKCLGGNGTTPLVQLQCFSWCSKPKQTFRGCKKYLAQKIAVRLVELQCPHVMLCTAAQLHLFFYQGFIKRNDLKYFVALSPVQLLVCVLGHFLISELFCALEPLLRISALCKTLMLKCKMSCHLMICLFLFPLFWLHDPSLSVWCMGISNLTVLFF